MRHLHFFSRVLALMGILLSVIISGCAEDGSTYGLKAVPSKLVCMVNDRFMGTDQIPITADGKTYYGCCQGCVSKLQNNQNEVRFSPDPATGERVDKAQAFIVHATKEKDAKNVLYFQSKDTYQKYLKQLAASKR